MTLHDSVGHSDALDWYRSSVSEPNQHINEAPNGKREGLGL